MLHLLHFLQHGRFVPVHFGRRDVNHGALADGSHRDRMRRVLRTEDAEGGRHQLLVQQQRANVQRNLYRGFRGKDTLMRKE